MTDRPITNLAASVRQRLFNLAKTNGDDFQRLLTQYALERLLFRIGRSKYANRFVLKGALLFLAWIDEPHRRTKDLDLLGFGDPAPAELVAVFRELCAVNVESDGLFFDPESVAAKLIRDETVYGGVRVTLIARLENARSPLQIDIGYGDVTTPDPEEIAFPTLLEFPAARIRAYARETVVAEKLSAVIELDMDNTRMKDFFDLWILALKFPFEGNRLSQAINATLSHRGVSVPSSTPTGLSEVFTLNVRKQIQWRAFVAHNVSRDLHILTLEEAVGLVRLFILPILHAMSDGRPFDGAWVPGGPWREP